MKNSTRHLVIIQTAIVVSLLFNVSCKEDKQQPSNKNNTGTISSKPKTDSVHAVVHAPKPQLKKTGAFEPAAKYFDKVRLPLQTAPVKIDSSSKQSVVLIIIDAFNAKHLSAYGANRPTPNIDALAKEGVLFTNHVSNSSWTRPSFTTIITGQPKNVHGVELNGRNLEKEITTVAEYFRQAGYKTAAFIGNPLARQVWGFAQGFQVYMDTKHKAINKAFPPDSKLVDQAMGWLDKRGDDPFYLMIFMTAPHVPYRPPTRFKGYLGELPKGKIIEYPFKEYLEPLPTLDHNRMVAAYDGDVAFSDEQVGRLVEYLQKSGRIKNTSIVVTADHGEVFGDKNCYVHAYHMWEPALRVPLIIRPASTPQKGFVFDGPTTHIDVGPTLLALAGLDVPAELPGISTLRRLEKPGSNADRIILSEYDAHNIRRQAVRKGRWKLIHHHPVELAKLADIDKLHTAIPQPKPKDLRSLSFDKERWELYDMNEDPLEKNDLFSERIDAPATIELINAVKNFLGNSNEKAVPQLSEETIKALQAAGYMVPGN